MAIRILNNHYKLKKLNPDIVFKIISKNIDEKNEVYNAFINRDYTRGEIASKSSTHRFEKNNPNGILDGIPIVVKDNFCIENEPTTCGSKMLENFKPVYTATSVKKLIEAGVIIIGKTNMDEFAMGSGSVNSTFGKINNPWVDFDNEICVTGGSSGGTAVAIAAGWALAGLGTDTGGSIRLPAMLTGLVGLKPTYGAISRHGVIALMNSLDTPSIMSRLVEDSKLIFDAIKGQDIRDPTSLRYPTNEKPENFKLDVSKLTIGIPQEFYPEGLINDIAELWEDTAEFLSKLGCNVVKVSLPHMQYAGKCYSVLCCAEVASNMARYGGIEFGFRDNSTNDSGNNNNFLDNLLSKSRSVGLGSAVRERILMGNFFLLKKNRNEYFDQARKIWRLISDDFQQIFNKVDLLLTPTALEDAPSVKTFTVLDNRVAMVKGDICTQPSSLAGVPAISLPMRLSARGLPIGIQLVANRFEEDLLFDVGEIIEKWAGFHHRFQFVYESAVENLDKCAT